MGGDTWFANTQAAYDALEKEMKQRLQALKSDHQPHAITSLSRPAQTARHARTARGLAHSPQPLVCTHPVAGRKDVVRRARRVTESKIAGGGPRPACHPVANHVHRAAPHLLPQIHKWRAGAAVMWTTRPVSSCHAIRRRDPSPGDVRNHRW